MSKFEELQAQYQTFSNAMEALQQTRPNEFSVEFQSSTDNSGGMGILVYYPGCDYFEIVAPQYSSRQFPIACGPYLLKALNALFGDEEKHAEPEGLE